MDWTSRYLEVGHSIEKTKRLELQLELLATAIAKELDCDMCWHKDECQFAGEDRIRVEDCAESHILWSAIIAKHREDAK